MGRLKLGAYQANVRWNELEGKVLLITLLIFRSFGRGWLAREDKVEIVPEKKTFRVGLK